MYRIYVWLCTWGICVVYRYDRRECTSRRVDALNTSSHQHVIRSQCPLETLQSQGSFGPFRQQPDIISTPALRGTTRVSTCEKMDADLTSSSWGSPRRSSNFFRRFLCVIHLQAATTVLHHGRCHKQNKETKWHWHDTYIQTVVNLEEGLAEAGIKIAWYNECTRINWKASTRDSLGPSKGIHQISS